jgi:RNA-binding protein 5/10
LVVRGLDTKTTEEKLWQIFEQFSPSIVALRLIRDKISGVSRGFCFIEFPSVEDAQLCLAACQLQPVVIDGRIVKITYTNRGTYGAAGPYSAISLNGTFLSRTQIQNYYDQTYSWNPDEKSSSNVKCPDILSLINDGTIKSGLVFDSNSGYYYNSLYSIYYDGTSDYYWDSQTGNYYNFDPQTNKYILWQTSSSSNQSKSSNETESSGKGTSKTASSNKKIASSLTNKKISKEIQKWSQKTKELNESEQEELKKQKVSFSVKTKKSNKVIMNNLSNDDEINENTNTTTTTSTTINTEVKNLTNTESTTNLPEINLSNICLLCKRQFNSSETLKKHIAFSELHKKNLELQKQSEKKREGEDNDKLNKKSKSEQ